jgi:hypothetical protein
MQGSVLDNERVLQNEVLADVAVAVDIHNHMLHSHMLQYEQHKVVGSMLHIHNSSFK